MGENKAFICNDKSKASVLDKAFNLVRKGEDATNVPEQQTFFLDVKDDKQILKRIYLYEKS